MEPNIAAMLHVHGALLAAICETHPDPEALGSAFTFQLSQLANEVLKTEDMRGRVETWARTYRRHIQATPAGDPAV